MSASPATLLQLMWLASPALPVGGFSYSEGLEAAVESGLVYDEASAATWLLDQLGNRFQLLVFADSADDPAFVRPGHQVHGLGLVELVLVKTGAAGEIPSQASDEDVVPIGGQFRAGGGAECRVGVAMDSHAGSSDPRQAV